MKLVTVAIITNIEKLNSCAADSWLNAIAGGWGELCKDGTGWTPEARVPLWLASRRTAPTEPKRTHH